MFKKIMLLTIGTALSINSIYGSCLKKLAIPTAIAGISFASSYPTLKTEAEPYQSALDVIRRCKPWPAIDYKWSCGKYLNKFDVNQINPDGYTALHYAANHKNKDIPLVALKELLRRGAKNIASESRAEETPLHVAASWGSYKQIDILLQSGIDPNPINSLGFTPLHEAALWGKIEAVKTLIAHGADVNIKNNQNQTALDLAFMETPPVLEVGETLAELNANKLIVASILKSSGAYRGRELFEI